ncbi:MAG: hypothetical protein WDO24_25105 [Pseudomonadota bacterium]
MAPPDVILETAALQTWLGGERRWLHHARPPVRARSTASICGCARARSSASSGEVGLRQDHARPDLARRRCARPAATSCCAAKWSADSNRAAARQARREIQYVHQDPGAALDPWWSIGRTLAKAW